MTDAPTPLQILLGDRPLAERLLVAEAHDGRAHAQEQRRRAAAIDPPTVSDADGFARARREAEAEADLAGWDDAVDAVRAEAGLPPHSGLPARLSGEESENMDHLLDRHADGLRAVLADPDADERRLAAALALLVTRDAVTVDDLEPLLASPWRKRLLVKNTNAYSPGAPAVVSVIRLLRRAGDERAAGMAAVVARDKRQFMRKAQNLTVGVTGPDDEALARLWDVAMNPPRDGDGDSFAAYLVALAERDGTDGVRAVANIWDAIESPHRYVWREAVHHAMGVVAYGDDLVRAYMPAHSPRLLDAGLKLAADPTLPDGMRVWAMDIARDSYALERHHLGYVPTPQDCARLRAEFSRWDAELPTGPARAGRRPPARPHRPARG